MLFIIELAKATNNKAPKIARAGFCCACFSTNCVNEFREPVRTSAPTMINIAAIVQGAGFDKTITAIS